MAAKFVRNGKVDRWVVMSMVVLAIGLVGLASACGGTANTTSGASITSATHTTVAVTTTAASPTATKPMTTTETEVTTTAELAIRLQTYMGIPYMTRAKGMLPAVVNVYAPKEGGPRPVVVMLHGGGGTPIGMTAWATQVARRGAVVFVPEWGRAPGTGGFTPEELRALFAAQVGDVAAAIQFARSTATRYGGDPANLTLFGHSAGAMQAVVEALGRVPASEGALKSEGSTIPESLVLFDPDYLLADPMWDSILAADPQPADVMKLQAAWSYLGQRVDFPITVIDSGDPGLGRELGDPWAKDSWLAVRDPSGDIRRGLEKLGALSGDLYVNGSVAPLFVERLKADGDTVTYIRLSDSNHTTLGPEGMKSFLEALVPKAQP
jgi:acetyl esterase/lipase